MRATAQTACPAVFCCCEARVRETPARLKHQVHDRKFMKRNFALYELVVACRKELNPDPD